MQLAEQEEAVPDFDASCWTDVLVAVLGLVLVGELLFIFGKKLSTPVNGNNVLFLNAFSV